MPISSPEAIAKRKAYQREYQRRKRQDPKHRERMNAKMRERYRTDPAFRQYRLETNRAAQKDRSHDQRLQRHAMKAVATILKAVAKTRSPRRKRSLSVEVAAALESIAP